MVVQAFRVVLLIVLLSINAFAWDGLDYFTYFGTTAETITCAWNPSETAEKYQVRALHREQNIYVDFGITNNCEHTVTLPRSGHYIFEVRAMKLEDGSATAYLVSEWIQSIDPEVATVDGNHRAWWVYGCVAPPGPIEPLDFYF